MPFRQPADRTILNPPKSRNVCSPCFTFPLPASPRCGAPLAPHTAFSELFSEAFSEVLPKRFPNESKCGHLTREPSKRGCQRVIGSNPKVKAIALTSNCILDAPACILDTGFALWALQLPFSAKGSHFGRSSCHFQQRVRTFCAPAATLSKGFELWVLQLQF